MDIGGGQSGIRNRTRNNTSGSRTPTRFAAHTSARAPGRARRGTEERTRSHPERALRMAATAARISPGWIARNEHGRKGDGGGHGARE